MRLLAIVSVVLGGFFVFSSADAATPSSTIDDKTTTGTNRFTYTGTWVNCGPCVSGIYSGSFKYGYTVGATATLTFSGTSAIIYGIREPVGGVASVSVDGGPSTDVTYYSASQSVVPVITTPTLANGTHTVKITIKGVGAGGYTTVTVDKAEIFVDTTTPSPTPTTSSPSPTSSSPSPTRTSASPTPTTSSPSPTRTSASPTPTSSSPSPTRTSASPTPTTSSPSPTRTSASPTPTTASPTAVPTTTAPGTPLTLAATIDDLTTSGTHRFGYTGSWVNCGPCVTGLYQNSFQYAFTTGNSVTFTFTGTRAILYGLKEPAGGIASLSVDGGPASDVDFWNASQVVAPVVTTPVLANGTHTVTLTVTGRSSSFAFTISMDKGEVYTGGTPGSTPSPTTSSAPPSTPPVTPTPTPTVTPPPPTSGGIASLTFDDGQLGQYNNARPILNAAGVHGTFYVVSDALDWVGTNMNPTQVRQLSTDGHEVGNHTRDHSNLASLGSAAVQAEFSDSQNAFSSRVGVTPSTCAYPYGAANSTVESIASNYFAACRGTNAGRNARGALNRYNLVVYYVNTGTTAAQVQAAAQSAIAENSWVIFVYHGVDFSPPSSEDVTPATLQSHVDALKASGISIQTVAQALGSMG